MKSSADAVEMKSFDSLFGSTESNAEAVIEASSSKEGRLIQLRLDEMDEFVNHPFKVKHDKRMAELVESVKKYGVLVPGMVRKKENGRYEIVAGHCRREASRLAEIGSMPVILRNLTDAEATIIMVDSNIQREDISIKEKAFAYKMKFDALKKLKEDQRKRNNIEVSQVGTVGRTDEIMAKQMGESRNQVQRYIRLTYLIEELLDYVDAGKIAFNAGVELSFMTDQHQQILLEFILQSNQLPSQAQAEELKAYSKKGQVNKAVIELVMQREKELTPKVIFKNKVLRQYFPDSYDNKKMEAVIIQLLEKWKSEQGG